MMRMPVLRTGTIWPGLGERQSGPRSFSRLATAAALVAAAWFPHAAVAEDLVQVFDLARVHDPALQALQAQSQAATPRVTEARAALLPNLSVVGASTSLHYDPSAADVDTAGTHVDSRSNTVNLNLRQTLYNPAAVADLSLAEAGERSAQLDFKIALQDFILRVAQAYFDVLAAQDVLATKQLSKVAIKGQLDAAHTKTEAGLGVVTDEQDAQARYDLAQSEEVAAENDVRVSRLVLDRLTGRTGVQPNRMTAQPALAPTASDSLDSWIQIAARHPAVQRAEIGLDRARLELGRARAGYLPTVDLIGNVGTSHVSGAQSPLSTMPPGHVVTSSVGVQIVIPLFSGLSTAGRVSETALLAEQARQNVAAAAQTATEQTERAFFDLQSSLARVNALAAAEDSSRASFEGTQRGYNAGLRLNLDVLNAQAQLFQTRTDLARARYNVLVQGLRLSAAAGSLLPESLLAVNRLLTP